VDHEAAQQAIRRRALDLPEAFEQERWGHPVFKLPKGDEGKLFCILSADGDVPVRATVKLDREEREVALTMPWCQVASYIGRWGWVTGEVVDDESLRAICDWLVESFWLNAPPRLRSAVEQSPFWEGDDGDG
jgi:predicted DNA-binding protein (MmcQ/YjbR family)